MQIRTRLTVQFTGLVALIMLISYLAIYYFSAQYRESQYYDRLRDKARTTADLLIRVDAVSKELLRIIDKNKKDLLYKEKVTVYNYLNENIYSSNDTIEFNTTPAMLNVIRLEGEQHWRMKNPLAPNEEFEIIGLQYTDRFNRFVVTAGGIDRFGYGKLGNLRNILYVSFVLILAVVALSGWLYAGRSLRPISRIVDQVNTISPSKLDTRLDEGNRKDEIARLSATFNQMLNRIDTTFQLQKAFVANASHELKNPLTVISSQLEVVLMRDRTPEEYRKTLASVLEDIRELNEVSIQLLELARLNNDEVKVDFKPLRVDELIWLCKDDLLTRRPDYKIIFTPELPEEERQLIVLGNEPLLKTAFSNLMENACKFSPGHEANVTLRTMGSRVSIEFKDNGIGISENDLPFIFQPFYRGNNAKFISGHGIGLPLVEKIVKLHNAQISASSLQGKGSVFTIIIPSASIL